MKLLIKNGHVIDPANDLEDFRDILVDNSKIARVAADIAKEHGLSLDEEGFT